MTPTLRSSLFIKPSILQKTLFDYFSLAKNLAVDETISKLSFEDKLIYSFNKDPLRVLQMITASAVLLMFVVHVHPHPILNRLRPSFFRLVLFGLILSGLIDIVANIQPYALDEAETKATALENIRSSLTSFATSQSSIALMFFVSIWLLSSQITKSYGALPKMIIVGLGLFSVAQFAPTLALLIALTSHDVFEEFLPHIQLLWSVSKGEKEDAEAVDSTTTSPPDVADSSIGSDSSPIHSLLRDIQRLGHLSMIIGGLSLMKLITQHGGDSLSAMASTTATFLIWFQVTQLAVREVTDQGTSVQRLRSLIRSLLGYVRDGGEEDDDFDWKTVKGRVSLSAIPGFFRRVKAFGTNVMTEVRDNLAAFEPTQIIAEEELEEEQVKGEGNDDESMEPLVSSKKKRRSAQRGKRPRRRSSLKRKMQQKRRRSKPVPEVIEREEEIDSSSHQDADVFEVFEDVEVPSVETEVEQLTTVDTDADNIDDDDEGNVEVPTSSGGAMEEESDQGNGRQHMVLGADCQEEDCDCCVDHASLGGFGNNDNMTQDDKTEDLTSASLVEEIDANDESDVSEVNEEEDNGDEDWDEDEDEVVVEEDRGGDGDEEADGETAPDDLEISESISSQSSPSDVSISINDENERSSRVDIHEQKPSSVVETHEGATGDGDSDVDVADEMGDSDVDHITNAESEVVQIIDEDEVEEDDETEGIVVVDNPAMDEDYDDNGADNDLLSSGSEDLTGDDNRGGSSSSKVVGRKDRYWEGTEVSANNDEASSPEHAGDEPHEEHEQHPQQAARDDTDRSDEATDAVENEVVEESSVINDEYATEGEEEADYLYEYEYEYEYEDSSEPAATRDAPEQSTVHNTTTTTQANDGFAPSLFAGDDTGPWSQ